MMRVKEAEMGNSNLKKNGFIVTPPTSSQSLRGRLSIHAYNLQNQGLSYKHLASLIMAAPAANWANVVAGLVLIAPEVPAMLQVS
jgi:hypothetical protein